MTSGTPPTTIREPLLLRIATDALELELSDSDGPARITRLGPRGAASDLQSGRPAVEVLTVDSGHEPSTPRLVGTAVGYRSVPVGNVRRRSELGEVVEVRSVDGAGLETVLRLELLDGIAAVRASTLVRNTGTVTRVLRSVTSFATRVALAGATKPDDLRLARAASDWVGESRWSTTPLRDQLVDLRLAAHEHGDARGCFAQTSSGTWSTGRALPVGVLEAVSGGPGSAVAWQVEHNGGWRWEVGEDDSGVYLAMSGPTDDDHQWLLSLVPGESFETVPATIAFGDGLEGAIAELTAARRLVRRPHPDQATRPVVFNDYMNTLMGDPTTERLLPLIDRAAEVGAEVFCIDAGWYDDSGDWWYTVGDWQPSTLRFPDGGLAAVVDRIRERDMVAGLWLEPEVIGVDSPAADRLPAGAFLQRAGQRIVEHGRYHLDLRHPAAVAHLDEVVDRLVCGLGVGYLKLDYNINPGAGTDVSSASPGDGLLQHNRAHLQWLERVLDRHPTLVLENCASGAMRMDAAMLARLQLQSTSDQQSPDAYPPIAAAAPLAMTPEQAANWAYPQPEMSDEEIAFTLCTTMLGRGYLSGRLDQMTTAQLMLVAEAVAAHKRLRSVIAASTAFWPLGIDQWTSPWVALGLSDGQEAHLTLWRRDNAAATIEVPLPAFRGGPLAVETVFPRRGEPWDTDWDPHRGVLTVTTTTDAPAARTLRIGRAAAVNRVRVFGAERTRPVHGGATGMLYGLGDPGIPSPALLAGARPRTVAQKAPGGAQHPGGDALTNAEAFFNAGGQEVLVYVQDTLAHWPYEDIGIDRYAQIAEETARGIATRPDADRFVHVLLNEPDWIWYEDWSPAGRDRFLRDWDTLVRAVRRAQPGARVAGPNDARYNRQRMRDFLQHGRDHGLLPDVVTWHELQPASLETLPAHLAHYRALERELGIPPLPVNIDEYANRRDTSVPGRMLQWIDLLETGGVDGDIAYWTAAGNLDDHAVRDGEPNGGWWLLHWYAALRGHLTRTQVPVVRVRDSLHALAAADHRSLVVLVGGGHHDIALEISDPPPGVLRVRVERAPWTGYEGALSMPIVIADAPAQIVDGVVRVDVPNDDPFAAYRISLIPAGVAAHPVVAAPIVIPADDADSAGERVPNEQDSQQYAGTGRAALHLPPAGEATFSVAVDAAGEYELGLLYGTDGVPEDVDLSLDSAAPAMLHLPPTLARGYTGRAAARLPLTAGQHTILIRRRSDGGLLALDRIELTSPNPATRLDAVLALRDGGRVVTDQQPAVELQPGERVHFFISVDRRGRYRLDLDADASARALLHGQPMPTRSNAALPVGVSEVIVEGPGRVRGLRFNRVADLAPFVDVPAIDSNGPTLDPGTGTGPRLLTVLASNAERNSGHEYNTDIVHRRLAVVVDGAVVQEVAFPYTHDWSNPIERAILVDVPAGTDQILLRPIDDHPPHVTGAAVDRLFETVTS